MSQPEIFVSYAWRGESEALVDRLCTAFAARGYAITRDKSAMTYRDSIRAFMDRIGAGRFIIAVVSDRYMKSEYCMYEAYRMFQSPAFRQRVFPIVLPDADVFSFTGQAAYLKYWDDELKARLEEYRQVANSSPTMVAPLTERLRDIEATTRFINDFMALVADMNVLTSQMHLESDFAPLIEAISARMDLADAAAPEDGSAADGEPGEGRGPARRQSSGGAAGEGGVNTGGGDFIGRDQNVSIHVGGNISGSQIVTGNNNIVINSEPAVDLFNAVYQAIERAALSDQARADLAAEVAEIESGLGGPGVDESWLARRLRNLKRMAPEIAEIALAALAGPGAAAGVVARRVAERIRAEAG